MQQMCLEATGSRFVNSVFVVPSEPASCMTLHRIWAESEVIAVYGLRITLRTRKDYRSGCRAQFFSTLRFVGRF